MAIEVNVRKRKHNQQNDEHVAPKKHKKTNTPEIRKNKPKNNQTSNETVDIADMAEKTGSITNDADTAGSNKNITYEEKPMKFSNDFKMMNFRTKLRGTSFITELRHFLYLSERNTRIVAKYIEKRGKPLELAEALERVDKTNLLHVAYVCHALHAVVMEIVSNQQTHMESAVSACRYFLKVHSNVVEQLLESAQVKHRRIALKLLTAIVCVEPQLGRQILAAFNLLFDVRKIEQLLSHSKFELGEQETVRKCYIHFVLAYLIDGNTLLVQNILDRSTLIHALVSGLCYDDHTTVCLVLNTLKKYVLESVNISKTKKIHVFNLECCKRLVILYNWHGPKVFAAKFSGKQTATSGVSLSQEKINALVDPTERDAVAAAVHEFLLMLFSSRKHGITFDAVTHFRQKYNAIPGKIIGTLHKPWCDMRKTELIVKTLVACPDLARHTMRNFANVVDFQRTGEKEWIRAAEFLTEIITTVHPSLLRNAVQKLTLTDFTWWIKDICLPLDTLIALKSRKTLHHSDENVRLASHRLLLAMFTQYSNWVDVAIQREQSKGGSSSMRRFKFDLYNHLLTHFPTISQILASLDLTSSNKRSTIIMDHLHVTLDLILVICKQNRIFVNKTSTILDYLKLLRPLYAGEDDDDDESDEGDAAKMREKSLIEHSDIILEMKAVKTILLLYPNALDPHQELFANVLKSFIKGFVYGSDEVQRESGELLREIFTNTRIFESCALEIDLWLEALRFVDAATVDIVTQVFVEVLKVTKAEVEMPTDDGLQINKSNLNALFENIEKGHSVQTYVEAFTLSKLLPLILKGVEILPPLDTYIELVSMLFFHYHPTPSLMVKIYEAKFENTLQYMRSWLVSADAKHEKHLTVPKILERIPFVMELQNALLKPDAKSSFQTIFGATNDEFAFELEIERESFKLHRLLQNERLVLIYIQQVIFLVVQLVEKKKLKRVQAELAATYISNFLNILRALENKHQSDSMSYSDDGTVIVKRSFLGKTLAYIYDTRLGHVSSAQLCNVAADQHELLYLHFITLITVNGGQLPDFSNYISNFRLKIVKAVAISLDSLEATKQQTHLQFIKTVEACQLNSENCVELLDLLCKRLKYSDFIVQQNDGFHKTLYYELLIYAMRRLASLEQAVPCEQSVKLLAKFYTRFVDKMGGEINLEAYEEALHDLLSVLHQYIPRLDDCLFKSMFTNRKLTKAGVKLASLLLARSDKLSEVFLTLLPDHLSKRDLIYPLLEIAFHKRLHIELTVMTQIYQEYRNGFLKSIEKPQKTGVIYKDHATCSVALVAACMPETECMDFCKKRLQLSDASEHYQIRLIRAIYQKAFESADQQMCSVIFVNFLNLQMQMVGADLKRQTLDLEKLSLFAYHIYAWLQQRNDDSGGTLELDFQPMLQSQQWLNFCKSCLKQGMQFSENEIGADEVQGLLLRLLAYLCDEFYVDFKEDESQQVAAPVESLFEMICTHSRYYDILLQSQSTAVKTQVLHLLYSLAKKNPITVLPHVEIPVILGAYQAKLTAADRYALALLQLYELHYATELQQYRPFIWGESAISCYALRGVGSDERTRLTQQETTIALVMSLIERHTCEYTIDNFPIWRKLNAMEQLPTVDFPDPAQRARYYFGGNELERHIELSWSLPFTQSTSLKWPASIDLRLCPKREEIYAQCYDPAFFIPLMSSCFAPESYAHPARPVQNGLLGLCFAALSAQDKLMRQAAGNVQLRYRTHFEQSKFYERPLWIQAYENIQAGLAELCNAWVEKHRKHSKQYVAIPRVPYISGLFIAKTFNLTSDPTNLLYKQMTMYLRLKNTFNFQCVPEFNVLFHSPEVEHQAFRQFILDVIRYGTKCSSDLFLLVSTNTFKVLLGFYGSTMSTLETNLLVLSVFSTCVKIPAAAKIMIEHVGILPWLETVVSSLEFYQFDIIEGMISILSNLWYAVTASKAEFYNYNYLALRMYQLIVALLPQLSARIAVDKFARLLNVMEKTAATACVGLNITSPYLAISADQLDKLLTCAQRHFGPQVQHLNNIRILGGAGAASYEDYCSQLNAQSTFVSTTMALASLRSYLIEWWRNNRTETLASNMNA